MTKQSRTSREIQEVLIALDLLKEDREIRVERTYAGSLQKAVGWCSWVATYVDTRLVCAGSGDTCKEIIRAFRDPNRHVSVLITRHDNPELFAENKKG